MALGAGRGRGHVGPPVGAAKPDLAMGFPGLGDCSHEPSLGPQLCRRPLQDQGHRPVVHEGHLHLGPEHPAPDGDPFGTQELQELGVEGLGPLPGAAAVKSGRRPWVASPYRVNWETQRTSPPPPAATGSFALPRRGRSGGRGPSGPRTGAPRGCRPARSPRGGGSPGRSGPPPDPRPAPPPPGPSGGRSSRPEGSDVGDDAAEVLGGGR